MTHVQIPPGLLNAFPEKVPFSVSAKDEPGTTNNFVPETLLAKDFILSRVDHREGDKEGSAWSPHCFNDNLRRSLKQTRTHMAVLDLDDGTPLNTIRANLFFEGLAAIIASSHSHLSTRTVFRRSELDAWRDANPAADEEGFMRDHRTGYVEDVWKGSRIVRDNDGKPIIREVREWVRVRGEIVERIVENIIVEHSPCPKFRVIVPLAGPFIAAEHDDADAAWKSIVLGLAGRLGLRTDKKTLDRAHLFYDPRHPAGVEARWALVAGEPFDAKGTLALARRAKERDSRERGEAHQERSLARQSFSAVKIFNGDIDLVRGAVMAVRNDARFDDRDDWRDFLAAIHNETGGSDEGREMALAWSAKWEAGGDDPVETEKVWNSFRDDRHGPKRTGATIRFYAWRDGWHGPEAFVYGDGRVEPSFDFRDERESSPGEQKRASPLQFHYAGDLHRIREATYLVKHWFFEGQLSAIYGPPGASKTFLALDIALHIALGWSWFEHEVKRGVVIYVALEGKGLAGQRR